jgi:hypothetical protein
MKHILLMACFGTAGWAMAQNNTDSVWRCGNEYTNQPKPGMACTRVPVQSDVISTQPRSFRAVPQTSPAMPNTTVVVPVPPRMDVGQQRTRDQHAQQILLDELKKLQQRCLQLAAQSTELVRCRADEAALRRELARLP